MIRLLAPAKLTTSLRIVGRRADGYHLLDAEMVSIDLADEIELAEGESGFEVRDEVAWAGLPGTEHGAGPPRAPGPGGDLVERALATAGRAARCLLVKHIPSGAGLGGGSSDAAAVLRWAGITDLDVAARLGADVPFCLIGGRAHVSGAGEVLSDPISPPPAPGTGYLCVTPRLHVATPVVYRAYDDSGAGFPAPRNEGGNDLEPAALLAYPALRWWRDLLAAVTGERPRLAGSGGTWFVEGHLDTLAPLADVVLGDVVAGRESALVAVVRPLLAPG